MAAYLVSDLHFKLGIDLGCGEGFLARSVRSSFDCLIGVDHNETRLNLALKSELYDELVLADVRDYAVPSEADVVFMLELVEHMQKADGLALLKRLNRVPVVILTTPDKYFSVSMKDGHVSYWHPSELEALGFKTYLFSRFFLLELFYGKGLLAVRAPPELSQYFDQKLTLPHPVP